MYKVTKKYGRGPETQVGSYKTIQEAKTVIQEKLGEDSNLGIKAIYCLYEGIDLIEEWDQSKLIKSEEEAEGSSTGGQQRGSGQSFSPSPFNTSPMPRGLPRGWNQGGSGEDEDQSK
jgi:hypothetical protein